VNDSFELEKLTTKPRINKAEAAEKLFASIVAWRWVARFSFPLDTIWVVEYASDYLALRSVP
jgi:hypothetical protein